MNKARRKKIEKIVDRLNELRSIMEELASDIEEVHDEEEECLDNMPESLCESERYGAIEAAVMNLDEAMSSFDESKELIDTVVDSLEEASL